MIFSSYSFIFIFFPIAFLFFCILRVAKKAELVKLWLVAVSLVFYALGQKDFVVVFLLSLLFNYLMILILTGERTAKALKVLCVVLSVVENIGLLVYFKYTNFIIENLNRLFGSQIGALSLILPIGISFFSFQIIASVVSAYKGEMKRPRLLDYMLFVSFFPQLIVGPVVLHDEIFPQIEGDALLKYDKDDIMRGIVLFSCGAAKKTVLANPMINFAVNFYSGDIISADFATAWLAVIAFTFAYYFDFSGYVDMARGLGLLFGIKLPANFNSPYKAENFSDFWHRWNITISRFFDNAIFRNLFGFGDRVPKLIFATLATFLVSGIWHGAAWHFIIWGLVCGALVAISNIFILYRIRVPKVLGCVSTFFVMMLVRVLFDAECMGDAFLVYGKLFSLDGGLRSVQSVLSANVTLLATIVVSAVICFCFKNTNEFCSENGESKRIGVGYIILAAFLLVLSVLNMSEVSTFLYFSF